MQCHRGARHRCRRHASRCSPAWGSTLLDQHVRARAALLGRLEEQAHAAAQAARARLEQPRGAQQHRDVRVMAARVHRARHPAPARARGGWAPGGGR